MEDFELKRIIYSYIREICHFSQMQVFATSYYQKNYFQIQIDERVTALIAAILQDHNNSDTDMVSPIMEQPAGEILSTLEELAQYDGSNGKAAYVAVDGVVYDVSNRPVWAGGTHFGVYSGMDLTEVFNNCHQGQVERLGQIPRIGLLVE